MLLSTVVALTLSPVMCSLILKPNSGAKKNIVFRKINGLKEIALQQMTLTKRQYVKENGYIAWHGYQSFKPDEVTPEQAHQIGLQLAKEMWGDRFQIIVTTHLDKDLSLIHILENLATAIRFTV